MRVVPTAREVLRLAARVRGLCGEIAGGILDICYPQMCAVCGVLRDAPLCAECLKRVRRIAPPLCHACGVPQDEPGRCRECGQRKRHFALARSFGIYGGVLREAILSFKFSNRHDLAPVLAGMLAEVMKDSEALNRHRFDFIVSVPSGRLPASRDYCAAQVLATELATITGLRYEGRILQKQKETIPQRELPLDSRLSNLRGAFCVRDNARLIGHQILLIDDIFTTGATADECAKVLMEAGAAGVRVLTVARGL